MDNRWIVFHPGLQTQVREHNKGLFDYPYLREWSTTNMERGKFALVPHHMMREFLESLGYPDAYGGVNEWDEMIARTEKLTAEMLDSLGKD